LKNTLICSAVESEISEIIELEQDGYLLRTIGIGLIDSAINLNQILLNNRDIKNVIFVGTAGAYQNSNLSIYDVVQGVKTDLFSLPFYERCSYFPSKMVTSLELNEFENLKKTNVASVLDINASSESFKNLFKDTGFQLEHMELFSVARVAKLLNKKVYSIFSISNIVDENAHEDWKKNNKTASLLAQEKLKELLLNV
jgi:nucleoside phosphorylase